MGRRRTSRNSSHASGDSPDPKRLKRATEAHDAGKRRLTSEEFLARAGNLKPKSVAKTARLLKTKAVERHLEENRKAHHTDEYELERLITRRGQSFKLTVEFEKRINTSTDSVFLQFVTGNKPQQSKGTIIRLPVDLVVDSETTSGHPAEWKCYTSDVTDSSVTVTVTPSADAVVGSYKLFVDTQSADSSDGDQSKHRHQESDELYILFNAWCEDDDVYLCDDVKRQEYVLNERGRIWMGSYQKFRGRPWNFGQFEDPCLKAVISLIDRAELCSIGRTSAISVIRCIAALANSSDEDGGVLTGRWDSDYPPGCTVPWAWNGSVAILTQYMETGKAVEFGQCWVFSGLVTTLLRAIGIPTRSVTNFKSAHDTDGSMTIDRHWDEDGEPLRWRDDSIWNFHVWNESWLRRPDLPEGHSGWQAHDSTPQEESGGVMRCGPAPLSAIKEGLVYLSYDIPFIFSEVNGDRVHWMVDEDENMKIMSIEKHSVGQFISTKAVGSTDREDITHLYKHPEGSDDERRVVRFVNRFSNRREIYDVEEQKDITLELIIPDNATMGDDFTITLRAKNVSTEKHEVKVAISTVAAFYTGIPSQKIKGYRTEDKLSPGDVVDFFLEVTAEEYEGFLNIDGVVEVYAQCRIMETNQRSVRQDSFFMVTPALLTIQMPERGVHREPINVTIKLYNPLKKRLTNGVFHIEGSSLIKPQVIREKKSILPESELVREITVTPTRYGEKELLVDFSCNEMSGVEGSATVYIPYPE